ncbi:hypothetical protein M422DRAFT_264220 [Sphaerobolus stellatus SS14]|uniref:Uncharacterized protein n=1 Tax=Sphaerobolus stellatus (strain SS14) TaxID=990650 RepID=A0A0C9V8J3_SPHS4|nr:hypothetical protein M422DRAFT_264220 [Sphaerobolus stellatus SS14]
MPFVPRELVFLGEGEKVERQASFTSDASGSGPITLTLPFFPVPSLDPGAAGISGAFDSELSSSTTTFGIPASDSASTGTPSSSTPILDAPTASLTTSTLLPSATSATTTAEHNIKRRILGGVLGGIFGTIAILLLITCIFIKRRNGYVFRPPRIPPLDMYRRRSGIPPAIRHEQSRGVISLGNQYQYEDPDVLSLSEGKHPVNSAASLNGLYSPTIFHSRDFSDAFSDSSQATQSSISTMILMPAPAFLPCRSNL